GPDLELRLGIYRRIRREHDRPVGLDGVRLLRVGTDDYRARKRAARALVVHTLVDLVTLAVRMTVVEDGVVIDVMRTPDDREPVHESERARAVIEDLEIVACELPAEIEGMQVDTR